MAARLDRSIERTLRRKLKLKDEEAIPEHITELFLEFLALIRPNDGVTIRDVATLLLMAKMKPKPAPKLKQAKPE